MGKWFLDVFSALDAQILKAKIALSQAPWDTTLEYPHAILLIIFWGDIFFLFFYGFLNPNFSKTRLWFLRNLGSKIQKRKKNPKKYDPNKFIKSIACGYSKVVSRVAWLSTIFLFWNLSTQDWENIQKLFEEIS